MQLGVKVKGLKYGWFVSKRGAVVIRTLYDENKPMIEKRYLGEELISITYFKKVKISLDI
jgi:hypothetical protein